MARIERSAASSVGRTAPLPQMAPKVENAIKEIARQTGALGADLKAMTATPGPLDIPGVDIQNVELPGQQYVNNGTQNGTSGTGTGRPRRADAGPAPQDFASAGPLPDRKPVLNPEVTETLPAPVDFANNGTQTTTQGTGTGRPRPAGSGVKAQTANA